MLAHFRVKGTLLDPCKHTFQGVYILINVTFPRVPHKHSYCVVLDLDQIGFASASSQLPKRTRRSRKTEAENETAEQEEMQYQSDSEGLLTDELDDERDRRVVDRWRKLLRGLDNVVPGDGPPAATMQPDSDDTRDDSQLTTRCDDAIDSWWRAPMNEWPPHTRLSAAEYMVQFDPQVSLPSGWICRCGRRDMEWRHQGRPSVDEMCRVCHGLMTTEGIDLDEWCRRARDSKGS